MAVRKASLQRKRIGWQVRAEMTDIPTGHASTVTGNSRCSGATHGVVTNSGTLVVVVFLHVSAGCCVVHGERRFADEYWPAPPSRHVWHPIRQNPMVYTSTMDIAKKVLLLLTSLFCILSASSRSFTPLLMQKVQSQVTVTFNKNARYDAATAEMTLTDYFVASGFVPADSREGTKRIAAAFQSSAVSVYSCTDSCGKQTLFVCTSRCGPALIVNGTIVCPARPPADLPVPLPGCSSFQLKCLRAYADGVNATVDSDSSPAVRVHAHLPSLPATSTCVLRESSVERLSRCLFGSTVDSQCTTEVPEDDGASRAAAGEPNHKRLKADSPGEDDKLSTAASLCRSPDLKGRSDACPPCPPRFCKRAGPPGIPAARPTARPSARPTAALQPVNTTDVVPFWDLDEEEAQDFFWTVLESVKGWCDKRRHAMASSSSRPSL